jgi:cysteine sulfinate desulfinase/cysteine desulfurase-like protein
MRSGTLPTPLIVGMGEACRIAAQEMEVGSGLNNAFFFTQACFCLRVAGRSRSRQRAVAEVTGRAPGQA